MAVSSQLLIAHLNVVLTKQSGSGNDSKNNSNRNLYDVTGYVSPKRRVVELYENFYTKSSFIKRAPLELKAFTVFLSDDLFWQCC